MLDSRFVLAKIARSMRFSRWPEEGRQFLHLLGVDRTVFYGVATRVWAIGASPISALLIAVMFTPEIQGYYYTFASLIALQVFVELGLGTVIIHFASHEWAHLALDREGRITGDVDSLSRLRSIATIAVFWFAVGAVIVMFGIGAAGHLFFATSTDYGVAWAAPWIALCVLTGLNVSLVPIWSLLEGCNQIPRLYTFRFVQGIAISILSWVAILSGAGLWTAAVSSVTGIVCAFFFIRSKYWSFLHSLRSKEPPGSRVHWHADMFPMQWRIAVSWISGYFAFSLFTPVLFRYHGPVVAGQMGMTWTLLGLLGIATSWLSPKVPTFGMLIARGRFDELDYTFWRVARIVFGTTLVMALAIIALVYLLDRYQVFLAARLLPVTLVAIFLLAQILSVSSQPFSAYLRAHKKEPLMGVSVLTAVLIGLSVIFLGKYHGAMGMAVSYLAVHTLIIPIVILVWHRKRIEWHEVRA